MAEPNYEIDIDAGRDDDEMQVDDGLSAANRKGRSFGEKSTDGYLASRNGRTGGAGNPAHATAVRCNISVFLFAWILTACSY